MNSQQDTSTQEVLAGLVERVTFHNSENGFCVLRVKARSHRDLVTVVGHAAAISAGEWVTATGDWVNDRTHGWLAAGSQIEFLWRATTPRTRQLTSGGLRQRWRALAASTSSSTMPARS